MLQTSPSTSQSLVRNAEQLTRLLSETLTNDTTEAIQTRTNIGNYKAHVLLHITDYTIHSDQS